MTQRCHFLYNIAMNNTPPPLSLYIHLPWCVRKCPYCDFNSYAQGDTIPQKAYIARLIEDFESHLAQIQGRPIHSIFFGGGTPSLFSGESIHTLLEALRQRHPWQAACEVTLEANPGTVEQVYISDYRQAGVNRLSIGIQSFHDPHLKTLGRIHQAKEAITAFDKARIAGFDNINIDLMHGLPQQTPTQALKDLAQAIALKPEHLSWYQLTLEPGTLFFKRPPTLPSCDTLYAIEQQGLEQLAQHHYQRYEVSAYAKAKKQCQHNLNYWRFGDYVGIGAGAHSKISDHGEQSITRFQKTRYPKSYLQHRSMIVKQRMLSADDRVIEYMMNHLRLFRPVPFEHFESRTYLSKGQLKKSLHEAEQKGLVTIDSDCFYATVKGRNFLNDLLAIFSSNVDLVKQAP
jgi:putative oxygen-independent coproporphyrinogen III oxidase